MPRVDRRWRNLVILTLLIYLLYNYFPSPPRWENNRSANRPAPAREQRPKPDFLYHSRFRENPDVTFEDQLDLALRRIESHALPDAKGAVKIIWQTGPEDADEREQDCKQWQEQNPGWEYSVNISTADHHTVCKLTLQQYLTDVKALDFVESLASVPSLVTTYKNYPLPILQADLLRYLLLWYYGGFYADIDVHPVHPITSCTPLSPLFTEHHHNISLVVSIEIDEPYASPTMKKQWHWSRTYGFIQYTLYASRRFSPFLRRAIVRVIAHSIRHDHQSSGIFHGPRYSEEDILEVTGPGMFTDSVLDVLSDSLPHEHHLMAASLKADEDVRELQSGNGKSRVTWAPFHHLKKSLWIDGHQSGSSGSQEGAEAMGGLLVLPINVWGNGQRHSGAEMFDSKDACVNHRFGRTWKKGWWEYIFG
jgi:Glycosyltransferase sugar-binding region containing DXD motif